MLLLRKHWSQFRSELCVKWTLGLTGTTRNLLPVAAVIGIRFVVSFGNVAI